MTTVPAIATRGLTVEGWARRWNTSERHVVELLSSMRDGVVAENDGRWFVTEQFIAEYSPAFDAIDIFDRDDAHGHDGERP